MRRDGRTRADYGPLITRLVYIYLFTIFPITAAYGVPIEIKSWDTQRAPLSHMVDVTNGFGLKMLAEHSFYNDNNIAFSPYGLMGILVALYEGVDGESSYQIQTSMQLPWNRNVMRIGFRDIHRTLKTYFVPKEGFLAGLALNNENVTFNEGYIKILRFYGFDLENETTTSKHPDNTTSVMNNTETTTSMSTQSTAPDDNKSLTTTTSNNKEETTANPNVETIDIDSRKGETTTTLSTPSTMLSTTETILTSTTQTNEQATTQVSTTIEPQALIETSTTQVIESQTTESTSSTMNDVTNTVSQITTLDSSTSPINDVTMQSTLGLENMPTTMAETASTDASVTNIDSSTSASTTAQTTDTLETLQRRKKSIVDFIYTKPPYVEEYEAYRSFNVGSMLDSPNEDNDKMFSVNGLRSIEVTYMHYDSVLEHAFLPHLEAAALRLPLDSDRYYLLVVLPMRRGSSELSRLLARMARESDLSDIYSSLRPCRVRAAVPSFIIKGHVILTTDLQKLGIRDVFEPRQHDFTPMTHQSGVYVRSIEQAVSVAIRKYQTDPPKAYLPNHNVVYFSATYPFLYFVMDANIHVALMAGKMVDPLNTRIL